MARSGRRSGASGTRERIRSAAQEAFGELGFEGTTIRAVAARAEVDPALVHHYFGTKQRLFLSVMTLPFDAAAVRQAVIAPGAEGVGERLVRFFVSVWDDQPDVRRVLTGIVRSASTDPDAAGLFRALLGLHGLLDVIEAVAPDDPELRAVLVGSQLIGLATARYIVRLEPLASADREHVVSLLGPTIERYLCGDLAGGRSGGDPSGGPAARR